MMMDDCNRRMLVDKAVINKQTTFNRVITSYSFLNQANLKLKNPSISRGLDIISFTHKKDYLSCSCDDESVLSVLSDCGA